MPPSVGRSWAQAASGSNSAPAPASTPHLTPSATSPTVGGDKSTGEQKSVNKQVPPQKPSHGKGYAAEGQKVPSAQTQNMRHRGGGAEMDSPLVLSLKFNDRAFEAMTDIRKAHFPERQNNLDAHLTILHALPSARRAEADEYIRSLTDSTRSFNLSLGALRSRPRIIMLPVRSKALDNLVYDIQERFWDALSDQDRQDFRGHVTLCNKHSEEETARRQSAIESAVKDRNSWACRAMGLDLWEYRGNRPWSLISSHRFTGA